MKFTFDILPRVEEDIQEAFSYYEDIAEELADDILLAVSESFDWVEESPLHYQTIYKNVRKCNIRRFPYAVYFTLQEKQISVIGVLHLKRNPKTWMRRQQK